MLSALPAMGSDSSGQLLLLLELSNVAVFKVIAQKKATGGHWLVQK